MGIRKHSINAGYINELAETDEALRAALLVEAPLRVGKTARLLWPESDTPWPDGQLVWRALEVHKRGSRVLSLEEALEVKTHERIRASESANSRRNDFPRFRQCATACDAALRLLRSLVYWREAAHCIEQAELACADVILIDLHPEVAQEAFGFVSNEDRRVLI